jgi:hypothetical protein
VQQEPSVLDNSKDTAILFATSAEYRQLMVDLLAVVRDMFGSYKEVGRLEMGER